MQSVNLNSLVQLYKTRNENAVEKYLKYIGQDRSIVIKEHEWESLESLICEFRKVKGDDLNLSHFFVGYIIPQIGKEFDLLRISKNLILNIEIKTNSEQEKIKKQLIRNKYYLNCLNREVYCITYVMNDKCLYKINDDNELENIVIGDLIDIINSQTNCIDSNIDSLFNPENYLISPFNKTEKFMSDEYFLTNEQEDIEKKIFENIRNSKKIISIEGKAGTGKTLLVYDIAKKMLKSGVKIGILHLRTTK